MADVQHERLTGLHQAFPLSYHYKTEIKCKQGGETQKALITQHLTCNLSRDFGSRAIALRIFP